MSTALLTHKLKIQPVERNTLFYSKYNYSVKFSQQELSAARNLSSQHINKIIAVRRSWTLGMPWRRPISQQIVDNLHTTCDVLSKHKANIKFVVSMDTGYVYTNDLQIVQEIKDLCSSGVVRGYSAQQVIATVPQGTIALCDPKWKLRTYFRDCAVTDEQKESLRNYLANRENVRLSPGLQQWVTEDRSTRLGYKIHPYVYGHFFIDHNDSGEVLFLNMVMPRITRRTFQIVAK